MMENMKTDREETFRFYLDRILDAMSVSSIDYDKLNCIMHDANMDFINDNLTYRQIATITRWIKNSCEICKEYRGNDCKYCQLGNPCLGCADYDIENDTCKSEGACADAGINRKVRINKVSKYEN